MACGVAIRYQPCRQPSIHADPIRNEELASGCGGHSDRVDDNNLVHGCCLATRQMGCRGAGAVFRLGVVGDSFAIVDYLDELGEAIEPVSNFLIWKKNLRAMLPFLFRRLTV